MVISRLIYKWRQFGRMFNNTDHLGHPLPHQMSINVKDYFKGEKWRSISSALFDEKKGAARAWGKEAYRNGMTLKAGEAKIKEWMQPLQENMESDLKNSIADFVRKTERISKRKKGYNKENYEQKLKKNNQYELKRKVIPLKARIDKRAFLIESNETKFTDAKQDQNDLVTLKFNGSHPSTDPSKWSHWSIIGAIAACEFFINGGAVEQFSDNIRIIAWAFAAVLTAAFFVISRWLGHALQEDNKKITTFLIAISASFLFIVTFMRHEGGAEPILSFLNVLFFVTMVFIDFLRPAHLREYYTRDRVINRLNNRISKEQKRQDMDQAKIDDLTSQHNSHCEKTADSLNQQWEEITSDNEDVLHQFETEADFAREGINKDFHRLISIYRNSYMFAAQDDPNFQPPDDDMPDLEWSIPKSGFGSNGHGTAFGLSVAMLISAQVAMGCYDTPTMKCATLIAYDQTEFDTSANVDAIYTLTGLPAPESESSDGYWLGLIALNDLSMNPITQCQIDVGAGHWLDTPKARRAAIQSCSECVTARLEELKESTKPEGLDYSYLWHGLVDGLQILQKIEAEEKIALFKSDLFHNSLSPPLSFYRYQPPDRLMKDYDQIAKTLDTIGEVDLTGIHIIVIYAPERKTDARWQVTRTFWRKFLLSKNAASIEFKSLAA